MKTSIKEIEKESKEINIKKVAEEILGWVDKNVESFIDNQTREFKLDLFIQSKDMPESLKLQELYRKVTGGELNDKDYKECMETLNSVTKKVHKEMKKRDDLLQHLFTRMSFYYEMMGISNGRPLVKELEGAVDIINFEYEAFSVGVKINAPTFLIRRKENGELENVQGENKDYQIPESFTIWIEIAFKEKRVASMF